MRQSVVYLGMGPTVPDFQATGITPVKIRFAEEHSHNIQELTYSQFENNRNRPPKLTVIRFWRIEEARNLSGETGMSYNCSVGG